MNRNISRKDFVQTVAMGGAGLLLSPQLLSAPATNQQLSPNLYQLSNELLNEWSAAVLALQVKDKTRTDEYGGIVSPDTGKIPGRCGDAIYPFFCMAEKTGDSKYMDAGMMVYDWMEKHVSDTADGAWLNEPQKNSWKGITVFTTIAICETLLHHHKIIDPLFQDVLKSRLLKSADIFLRISPLTTAISIIPSLHPMHYQLRDCCWICHALKKEEKHWRNRRLALSQKKIHSSLVKASLITSCQRKVACRLTLVTMWKNLCPLSCNMVY